jgi:hypothetical protein
MKAIHLLLFALAMVLVVPQAEAAEWVYWGTDKHGNDGFYDRELMSFPSKGIVRVWVKSVYSEKGKVKVIENRATDKTLTDGYGNLSHNLCHMEINCNTRESNVIACLDYDKSGTVLGGFSKTKDKPKWQTILTDSKMDVLRQTVCKLRPRDTNEKK